jgi:ribosomal protein L9
MLIPGQLGVPATPANLKLFEKRSARNTNSAR